MNDPQIPDTQPVLLPRRRFSRAWLFWALFGVAACLMASAIGGLAGYQGAWQDYRQRQSAAATSGLQGQYDLAVGELASGQYELARQRFEYVLQQDPAYPGAAEGLAQAMSILYATATPTAIPPTPTATPTPDLRPVQDLYAQAQSAWTAGSWNIVIDTIVSLRAVDPAYQVVQVDSLLYRTLRNRGIDKILKEANLEGGIYDLSLAEGFGPLDAAAGNWRNLARLYMIGSSFWEVFPEQAVYYFGQVAAAAPGLRDGSGWTARARYHASLIHLGDKLALAGDWCAAQENYDLAFALGGGDVAAQTTAVYAAGQCAPPTATATLTPEITPTPTVTATLPPGITPVDTPVPTPTATLPPSPTTGAGDTPTPTLEPPATPTPTQETPPTPTVTLAPPPDEPTLTPTSGGQL